jgi:hypothetical protein
MMVQLTNVAFTLFETTKYGIQIAAAITLLTSCITISTANIFASVSNSKTRNTYKATMLAMCRAMMTLGAFFFFF